MPLITSEIIHHFPFITYFDFCVLVNLRELFVNSVMCVCENFMRYGKILSPRPQSVTLAEQIPRRKEKDSNANRNLHI